MGGEDQRRAEDEQAQRVGDRPSGGVNRRRATELGDVPSAALEVEVLQAAGAVSAAPIHRSLAAGGGGAVPLL